MPATLEGLFKTQILDRENKLRFAYEVIKTLTAIEQGEEGVPIGEYLQQKETDEVRDLLLTLALSNFFTERAGKNPVNPFFPLLQTAVQHAQAGGLYRRLAIHRGWTGSNPQASWRRSDSQGTYQGGRV